MPDRNSRLDGHEAEHGEDDETECFYHNLWLEHTVLLRGSHNKPRYGFWSSVRHSVFPSVPHGLSTRKKRRIVKLVSGRSGVNASSKVSGICAQITRNLRSPISRVTSNPSNDGMAPKRPASKRWCPNVLLRYMHTTYRLYGITHP